MKKMTVKRCPGCDTSFSFLPARGMPRIYCTKTCGDRHYARLRAVEAVKQPCAECGQPFGTHRDEQKFCSNQCRSAAWASTAWKQKPCRICEEVFTPKTSANSFCSDACRKHIKRSRKQARRAREKDPNADHINPMEVYKRDEWRCGICGEAIDPEVKHPDLMSPSIDHIIPLACDGAHTLTNVQAAHFGCNVRKQHRVAQ